MSVIYSYQRSQGAVVKALNHLEDEALLHQTVR